MDDKEPSWYRLHLWQIQVVRDVLVAVFLIVAVWICVTLRSVVIPLVIGLLLADLYEPIVRRAIRIRPWVTRVRVVTASLVIVLTVIVTVLSITLPPLVGQTRQLVRDLPSYLERAVELSERPYVPSVIRRQIAIAHDALAARPPMEESTEVDLTDGNAFARHVHKDQAETASIRSLAEAIRTVIGAIWGSVSHLIDIIAFIVLVPLFAMIFSINFPQIRMFLRNLPPVQQRSRIAGIIHRIEFSVGGFFRGRLMVCLMLAVVYAIGLTICGVPYGLLVGLFTGMLCLLPWMHFLGLPLAWMLLAGYVGGTHVTDTWYVIHDQQGVHVLWWRVLMLPLAVWTFAQLLDDYILSPLIQGQKTDLHPAAVLVSIVAGGLLAGFYGLVLAVPVVACLKILAEEVVYPGLRWWSTSKSLSLATSASQPTAGSSGLPG